MKLRCIARGLKRATPVPQLAAGFAGALCGALASCGTAIAGEPLDVDLSIKPSILHGSAADVTAPALKFSGTLKFDHALGPDDDLSALVSSRGAVATDARANSDNLFVALHLGYSHQFANWTMVATTNRTSDRPGARPVLRKVDTLGGLLEAFFKSRFETDQPWENRQVTYGPHLGFSPTGRRGLTWLVPAGYVDYQRVHVLHSERNERLGIQDDSYWRIDLSAGWRFPVGEELLQQARWLRPVELEFDLHYFRSFDLPPGADAAGLDEGWYYAGTLVYNLRALNPNETSWPWWRPYAAYVSIGHGRQPPAWRDQTSVSAGLVFSWGN